MNKIAKDRGRAEFLAGQVINGVIVDLVVNIIAPQNKRTKVININGDEYPDNRINPIYCELMDILTKEKFSDLPIDRAEKIVGYLVQKSAMIIDDQG